MFLKTEEILNIPPVPILQREEWHKEEKGGWSSHLSFLDENVFPLLGTKEKGLTPSQQFKIEILNTKKNLNLKTQREIQEGIRNSFVPRPDLCTEIVFPSFSQKPYTTYYRLLRNGCVPGAITSSLDRVTPQLSMARQMTVRDEKGEEQTIAYAGRPDTWEKALALAELIFQGEWRTGQKLPEKEGVYQLKFAVNSSLSLIPGSAEYQMAQREAEILKVLNGQVISLRRPDGTVCKVRCEVIFTARQFNFCSSLEKNLSASLSGKGNGLLLSATSEELVRFLGPVESIKPEIRDVLEILKWHKDLSAEEELFCRILLFKRAGIPLVLHCKSCVDRTSLAIALAYALDQWQKAGRSLPVMPYAVLQNETFKELFYAHLTTAHWMTFYARGGKNLEEGFGFKWHQEWKGEPVYFSQHPGLLALLPERVKKIEFVSLKQMAFLPGGTIVGVRNIRAHFGTWVTARDQDCRRIFVAFCRALCLIPLLVKFAFDAVLVAILDPSLGFWRTLYRIQPEKVLPISATFHGRPVLYSSK